MFQLFFNRSLKLILALMLFTTSIAFAQTFNPNPSNSFNPFDSIGSVHNAALGDLTKSAPKTLDEGILLVDSWLKKIGILNPGNMNMSYSSFRIKRQQRVDELVKSTDVYTTAMKQGSSAISASYLKKIKDAGDSIFVTKSFTKTIDIENQIIADKSLSENERAILLGTASVSRHSAAFLIGKAGGGDVPSPARWPWVTDLIGAYEGGKFGAEVSGGNPWGVGIGALVGGAGASAISHYGW